MCSFKIDSAGVLNCESLTEHRELRSSTPPGFGATLSISPAIMAPDTSTLKTPTKVTPKEIPDLYKRMTGSYLSDDDYVKFVDEGDVSLLSDDEYEMFMCLKKVSEKTVQASAKSATFLNDYAKCADELSLLSDDEYELFMSHRTAH